MAFMSVVGTGRVMVKRAPPQGIRVRDNTIRNAAFTGLVLRGRHNSQDVISGNTIKE